VAAERVEKGKERQEEKFYLIRPAWGLQGSSRDYCRLGKLKCWM
jgi:hypothetical protein